MITLTVFCLLLFYGVNAWAALGAGFSWREFNVACLKLLGFLMVVLSILALLFLIITGMEKGVLP